MVHGLRGRSGRQAMKGLTMQKQEKPETTKASTGIPARVWVVLMLLCVLNVVAGSSPGTGRRSTSTRSVASVPAAGMRTVSSRSPSFSFHRILTTWLPSVLSVASMCRAVIFGSFSMRRVRFFPGHVPAVLTSVDAGRACGPIGASASQDGGSAWASWIGDESQKRHRSTTQSRHPFSQPRTMAEGALARFLPATTEDVVCARVLCLG